MIILKNDSIQLNSIGPELVLILVGAVVPVFDRFDLDVVITSGTEQSAKHSATSLHYSGAAVDIRTINQRTGRPYPGIETIVNELKNMINCDFDIVLESDHLHIEYQPKRRA